MNNFFENNVPEKENQPKQSSQKIRDFLFAIENENNISSGQESLLDEGAKSFKEEHLGDTDERVESGMLARSYITNLGLATEKIENRLTHYHRMIILDEELLKETFENLYGEMKQNIELNEAHYAATDIMTNFHESLIDENVDEMNKFEIMEFVKNNIVPFVEKCNKLYQEKGLSEDNLLSSNSAYENLIHAVEAMKNKYLKEYITLNNEGLVLREDLKTGISEYYLYIRAQNEHEDINTINQFITHIYSKIKVLIDMIQKNKDNENIEFQSFLNTLKNNLIENNKNLVQLIKNPEKLALYGIKSLKPSVFDKNIFIFFDEIESQLNE